MSSYAPNYTERQAQKVLSQVGIAGLIKTGIVHQTFSKFELFEVARKFELKFADFEQLLELKR